MEIKKDIGAEIIDKLEELSIKLEERLKSNNGRDEFTHTPTS